MEWAFGVGHMGSYPGGHLLDRGMLYFLRNMNFNSG